MDTARRDEVGPKTPSGLQKEAFRAALAQGATSAGSALWGGAKAVGRGVNRQLGPKAWGDAWRHHKELLKAPDAVMREGAKESFKGKAGKVITPAALTLEASRITHGGGDRVSKEKSDFVDAEFGEGASDEYREAKKKHYTAQGGHKGQRVGSVAGGIASWMATAAKKTKLAPAIAAYAGASYLGGQAGKLVDKARGRETRTKEQKASDVHRFKMIDNIVRARSYVRDRER